MLENLSAKQKIICVVVLIAMLAVIAFYGYTKLNETKDEIITNSEEFIAENQIEEDKIKQENKEVVVEAKIIVHITGEVKKSGILELPVGARIADAIKAAGGETNKADLDQVNLAYEVQDGQKIYIPSKEDKNKEIEYISQGSGNNVIVEGKSSQGGNKKVNINQAGQSELQELPGIGPALAVQIIEYRNSNGKFNKIEDLQNVKGIGDAKFNNIKEYVTVK